MMEQNQEKSFHEDFIKYFCTPGNNPGSDAVGDGDDQLVPVEQRKSSSPLADMKFVRVLKVGDILKGIAIEYELRGKAAVVWIEKTAFLSTTGENFANSLITSLNKVEALFHNDVYGTYLANIFDTDNDETQAQMMRVILQIIYPASQKDIEKYIEKEYRIIRETASLYVRFTKPIMIEKKLADWPNQLQWVYNVLEGKAEQDRIVYQENVTSTDHHQQMNGFILAKDMKWKYERDQLSTTEKSSLYITGLVMRRDLRSLRDLTADHLPLLQAMYDRGREAIASKYSLSKHELRCFIHYLPTYFHLHVHYTHISALSGSFQSERAHPLQQVIENISLMPDYYQRASLEVTIDQKIFEQYATELFQHE